MTDDPFAPDSPETDNALLDQLVEDYLNAYAGMEKYQERKDELAAELIAHLGPGSRHEIRPGIGVTIAKPSRRFDAKQAASVLTAEQLAAISEMTPSSTLAADRLPRVLLDLCKISSGKPSVRRI